MLRIRLTRTGKKAQPTYRVVVADKRSKRDGRIVERIGHYNPRRDPIEYTIDEARALHWLSNGAQASDAVKRLLTKQGTYDRLSRLNDGESLDALVAEYTGVPLVEETEEEEDKSFLEKAGDAVSSVVETVTETVSDAVEAVQEAVSGDDDETASDDETKEA